MAVFTFECRDKMACFDLKGRFCLAFKNFLWQLFEEDTLLILFVGKSWLKAIYQVVIFVSEICQFFLSKIGKICKIIKNPKNIRFAVE